MSINLLSYPWLRYPISKRHSIPLRSNFDAKSRLPSAVTHRPKKPATPPRANLYFGHIHKLTHRVKCLQLEIQLKILPKKKRVLDRQTRFWRQTDPMEKIQSFNWLRKQNMKRASKQIKASLRRTMDSGRASTESKSRHIHTERSIYRFKIFILVVDLPMLKKPFSIMLQ